MVLGAMLPIYYSAADRERARESLAIACPICGAARGKTCTTQEAGYSMSTTHRLRMMHRDRGIVSIAIEPFKPQKRQPHYLTTASLAASRSPSPRRGGGGEGLR